MNICHVVVPKIDRSMETGRSIVSRPGWTELGQWWLAEYGHWLSFVGDRNILQVTEMAIQLWVEHKAMNCTLEMQCKECDLLINKTIILKCHYQQSFSLSMKNSFLLVLREEISPTQGPTPGPYYFCCSLFFPPLPLSLPPYVAQVLTKFCPCASHCSFYMTWYVLGFIHVQKCKRAHCPTNDGFCKSSPACPLESVSCHEQYCLQKILK